MDLVKSEEESTCVTLHQKIAASQGFHSANGRAWLVHALLDPEQGFESDFPIIQVFAITTAVLIDNALIG